jgi:hypothetical protein
VRHYAVQLDVGAAKHASELCRQLMLVTIRNGSREGYRPLAVYRPT